MRVQLELNRSKTEAYNKRLTELKEQYPEVSGGIKEVRSLKDRFVPYAEITCGDLAIIQPDYREDFEGVYVCGLNSNHIIDALTDYKEKKNLDSPIYWLNYGVCDNASQVLDLYDSLCAQNKEYMEKGKFVILLVPMIRSKQPESGGWRWHKWGRYIGQFEPKCEYLYDEKGIDYVYCFEILEVVECWK